MLNQIFIIKLKFIINNKNVIFLIVYQFKFHYYALCYNNWDNLKFQNT